MPNNNWMDLWRLYNPQYGYGDMSGSWIGGVPGQFGMPADVAPASLSKNVAAPLAQAAPGATTLRGAQVPRGTDQKVNPNAVMMVPPRQQLAQIMAPQQPWLQYPYAGGPNYGSQGGSRYGGYSTSGPQNGSYGYGGGQGGWGWGGGSRSSATQGGMWGGLR
jgi:hypothetical protein